MHIFLLGATGRVGQYAMQYALTAGHQVTAVVRNPAKITQTHDRLTVVTGNVADPASLLGPMRSGIDVVVNAVGGPVDAPTTVVTDSTRELLGAMAQASVTRYIAISGIAEIEPCNAQAAGVRAGLLQSPIRFAVVDHDSAIALVKASAVNWTLAGCPWIKDGDDAPQYQIVPGCFPGGMHEIYPPDVADFLIKEVEAQRYPRQIVGIWR